MTFAPHRLRVAAVVVCVLASATGLWATSPGPGPGNPDPGRKLAPALRQELERHPGKPLAVWIDLDPKAAASDLPPALSPEALARRMRTGVGVLPGDRPIAPALVAGLRRAGARIRVHDRWSRSVSADVDLATARRIAALPWVLALSPVRRMTLTELSPWPFAPVPVPVPVPQSSAPAGAPTVAEIPRTPASRSFAADTFYGLSFGPLQQLDIPAVHSNLAFTGRGVRIGLLDTGFDLSHEALAPLNRPCTAGVNSTCLRAKYDFIWRDTVVRNQPRDTFANQWSHGTSTLSLVGGNKVGKLMGAAYGATFLLAKTEVDNPRLDQHQDEDRWVEATQWADSVGVDIISSSLGYRFDFPDSLAGYGPEIKAPDGTWEYPCSAMDGHSTKTSIAASALARRRILLVNAIGNDGPAPCTLGAPADADSILAVGAVDSLGKVAAFSSRGPTADGRVEPGLVARGVSLSVAVAGSGSGYASGSGTSFATPLMAGAAALVLQAWPNLAPLAIRQALILSAPLRTPNNDVGYGVPDVASAILFPQGLGIAALSPVDAIGQVGSIAPTFSWSAPQVLPVSPIVYRVDVATDSTFRTLVYSDTVSNTLQLTARRPLRPASGLFWRVVASYGSIQRSTIFAGPFGVPHWVRLVTLNDPGSTTNTPRPVLKWTSLAAPPPAGPLHFDVQILGNGGQPVLTLTDVGPDSVKLAQSLDYGTPYRWRVIARTATAADTVTSAGTFTVSSDVTPPSTNLYQNFPNPFPRVDLGANETHIWFDLTAHGPVELAVYDLRGRLVRRLIPAAGCATVELGPGLFGRTPSGDPCVRTTWDGNDDDGKAMPRGVYLLRLRAGGVSQTRHIVFTP